MAGLRPVRSFGRLRSRALKPSQAARLSDDLPRLTLPAGPLDPATLGPAHAETWLEIGFGGGEHLAAQARAHPEVLVLGAEPFQNGLASAVRHAEGLENIRLWPGDGRELMAALPSASLARLFVLFPDPWPKRRHHKRRLIDGGFAAEALRLLRVGGRLRFATDWEDYANQALEVLLARPGFAWAAQTADDWRQPPADHVPTRYQAKRLGDIDPLWFEFVRLP